MTEELPRIYKRETVWEGETPTTSKELEVRGGELSECKKIFDDEWERDTRKENET